MRARIVLLAADGLSNTAISTELATGKPTVGEWRERFATQRVDGLLDEPRSGAPRRIGDEQVAELIDRTLCERPSVPSAMCLFSLVNPADASTGAWREGRSPMDLLGDLSSPDVRIYKNYTDLTPFGVLALHAVLLGWSRQRHKIALQLSSVQD